MVINWDDIFGQWDSSLGKGACYQAVQPEIDPWNPHHGRRKPNMASWPLTSTCVQTCICTLHIHPRGSPSSLGSLATSQWGQRDQGRGQGSDSCGCNGDRPQEMTSARQLNFILGYRKYTGLGSLGTSPTLQCSWQHNPMKITRTCYLIVMWSAGEACLQGITSGVILR